MDKVYVTIGANNHTGKERSENDFYATDPNAVKIFLNRIKKDNLVLHNKIFEPACGMGHISNVLISNGFNVTSSDLIDRGYGKVQDFLKVNEIDECDIVTNPPYNLAIEFLEKSMELLKPGYFCVMFLKIQFLEGKKRRKFFDKYPPKYVYINSERQLCAHGGDFEKYNNKAVCYCWYIWKKGFSGEPVIRWI